MSLNSLPLHSRCFIFLFVLLENIGERASEARTQAKRKSILGSSLEKKRSLLSKKNLDNLSEFHLQLCYNCRDCTAFHQVVYCVFTCLNPKFVTAYSQFYEIMFS